MSVIEEAFGNLSSAIDSLEGSIDRYQRSAQARAVQAQEAVAKAQEQAEMFSDVDPALVSKKLDRAIQKVENVLADAV